MQELFHESVRLINFPLTLLVFLSALYWVGVILGMLDMEMLDFELDLDLEDPGIMGRMANLLHFGEAPFFVILSLLFIFMWAISMLTNYYWNGSDSILLGLVFLIPNFLVSLAATSIAVIPAHVFFKKLNQDEEVRKDVVGELCTVSTTKVDEHSGQAEVRTDSAPVVINARSTNQEILEKGQQAVVVEKNEDGTYIIKKLEA